MGRVSSRYHRTDGCIPHDGSGAGSRSSRRAGKIQAGAEVIVERDAQPVAIIKPAQPIPRTLSDLIRLAEQREKERGYPITLDEDFAADVEQIVHARKRWTPRSWDRSSPPAR
jgi:hypothetical protein